MPYSHAPGNVGWIDLTVADADSTRDFYSAVVGWQTEPLDMGGYSDYVMKAPDGDGVAGVCHARGSNANQPAVWMVYFMVADLDASLAEVTARGGEIIRPPAGEGSSGRFAVVRDPAGACCGLFQAAS